MLRGVTIKLYTVIGCLVRPRLFVTLGVNLVCFRFMAWSVGTVLCEPPKYLIHILCKSLTRTSIQKYKGTQDGVGLYSCTLRSPPPPGQHFGHPGLERQSLSKWGAHKSGWDLILRRENPLYDTLYTVRCSYTWGPRRPPLLVFLWHSLISCSRTSLNRVSNERTGKKKERRRWRPIGFVERNSQCNHNKCMWKARAETLLWSERDMKLGLLHAPFLSFACLPLIRDLSVNPQTFVEAAHVVEKTITARSWAMPKVKVLVAPSVSGVTVGNTSLSRHQGAGAPGSTVRGLKT